MLSKNEFTMSQSPSGVVDGTQALATADVQSNRSHFRKVAANRLQSLQKQHEREVYNHKFTMKEDALQVAVNQRSDSPRLVSDQREYDKAIKDYVQKEIAKTIEYNFESKFVRKTRMGGHMSNTLRKAGMSNVGIMQDTFNAQPGENRNIMINQDNSHF